MKVKVGDELFVRLPMHRSKPSQWHPTIVEKVTQKSLYVNFLPLKDVRISLETLQVATKRVTPYEVFVPTDKERRLYTDTELRSQLIGTILKTDWGALTTKDLQMLVLQISAFAINDE